MCAAFANMASVQSSGSSNTGTGPDGKTWISPENRQAAQDTKLPTFLKGFYARKLQNQQSQKDFLQNPNSYTVKYYDT